MHGSTPAYHQMAVQEKSRGFPAAMTGRGTQTFHFGAGVLKFRAEVS